MKLKFNNKHREFETIRDKCLIKREGPSLRTIMIGDKHDKEKEPIHDIPIVIKGDDLEKGVTTCVFKYAKIFGVEEGLHIISLSIKAFDFLVNKERDDGSKMFNMQLIQHNKEDRYDIYELMSTNTLPIPKGDVWIARIDNGADIPLISAHSFVTKPVKELMREDYLFIYRYIPDYAVKPYTDQMLCYAELRKKEKSNGKENKN